MHPIRLGVLAGADLNTVTPTQWRKASQDERTAFWTHWQQQGVVAFSCLTCGFPTEHGQASCEACP